MHERKMNEGGREGERRRGSCTQTMGRRCMPQLTKPPNVPESNTGRVAKE